MIKITISKFLIVLLTLPIMWSCKKDKDPSPTNPTPTTVRQATFQAEVSGDVDDSISITYNGNSGGSSVAGNFEASENRFSIVANQTFDTYQKIIGLSTELASVSVGTHMLGNYSWNNTTYSNPNLSTSNFILQSGSIEFTDVDDVPSGLLGVLTGKYVSGTFIMTLTNTESQNVSISGTFNDVLIYNVF
jgi:hypothetical protein